MANKFIPSEPGEVPTLGWVVIDWIEDSFSVPSGLKAGQPIKLYDEQVEWFLNYYRLKPDAKAFTGRDAFYYSGGLLVGPQKSGKSPTAAMTVAAEAVGPVVFAGWDDYGKPIGVPHPSPFIQILGSVKEQGANVIMPLTEMLEELEGGMEGLDAGATRIKLPKGKIEFTTSVASSRLGAPLTFVNFTESQLFTESSGLAETARTLVRNVSAMSGRWMSDTNVPSPIDASWALQVMESKDHDVYIYYKEPESEPEVDVDSKEFDPDALYEHIRFVYGGSLTRYGGHVSEDVIFTEMTRKTTGKGQALRFFGNCMVSLDEDIVNGVTWRNAARPGTELPAGARVGLAFDGSVTRDSTVISAFDVDTKTVHIVASWTRPAHADENWSVPMHEVNSAIERAYELYDVGVFFIDPYYYQSYADEWANKYGNVVDFPTNVQKRFDAAITTFQIALDNGELFHTDDPLLNVHLGDAVLKEGNLKQAVGPDGRPVYYKVIKKRKVNKKIDAVITMILAISAGGYALEKDMFGKSKKIADPFFMELSI